MCLDRLMTKEERKEHQPEVSRTGFTVGWKVFKKGFDGHLWPYYMDDTKFLPRRKWLHELDYRNGNDDGRKTIDADDGSRYPKGFHVYLKPVSESTKVYFREPVAWGWQTRFYPGLSVPCVVAKEIYIP